MDCCCNQGFFQGDDLVDVITVNRPENSDDITITQAILQVGNLEPIVTDNPIFPYSVSIMHDQSVNLAYDNPVYLGIIYTDTNGHTGVRKTCIGSLTLTANTQTIRWTEEDNE